MRILGIETSCDETAISVIEASGGKKPRIRVLANAVSSQVKLHAEFGGVVPSLAKREHQKNLVPILKKALKESGLAVKSKHMISEEKILGAERILEREPDLFKKFKKEIPVLNLDKIDAIAVTVGPGLEPALWAGINFTKALAFLWQKPLIPVNHLEGHIYSSWFELSKNLYKPRKIIFPAIALIVSGGHTELVLIKNYGNYKLIGETRDDAAGEAFDKVARLLNLGYPGGPIIDAIASRSVASRQLSVGRSSKTDNRKPITDYRLPRPMINSKDYDFSFSGLKTAVLYLLRDLSFEGGSVSGGKAKKIPVKEICREFQDAVIDVLVAKTLRLAREKKVKNILVSGGVAANSGLQRRFFEVDSMLNIYFPAREMITDNALMIAIAGYFKFFKKIPAKKEIIAEANLDLA